METWEVRPRRLRKTILTALTTYFLSTRRRTEATRLQPAPSLLLASIPPLAKRRRYVVFYIGRVYQLIGLAS